jgi:hypothetical protein
MKMLNRRSVRKAMAAGVACFVLALPFQASAGDSSAKPDGKAEHKSFDELDKNHDGYLKRSEIPSSMTLVKTRFASLDRDHDLRLSRYEFDVADRMDANARDYRDAEEVRGRFATNPIPTESQTRTGVVRQGGSGQ